MSRMLLPTELRRRKASPLWESNPRPLPYHGSALPTELRGRQVESTERAPQHDHRGSRGYIFDVGLITRFAERSDAARICAIYNHEVRTSLNTLDLEERSVDEQVNWISDRSGAHLVLVAVEAQRILGFAATSPYRDRAAYRPTVESSVYVATEEHGKGIGAALMRDLLLHTTQAGFHSVIARIQSTNDVSRRLHEQLGFRLIGTEVAVGRKFGKWVDMLAFQKMLEVR